MTREQPKGKPNLAGILATRLRKRGWSLPLPEIEDALREAGLKIVEA